MKIFNWVHRRFANKEDLTESGKKSCVVDSDGENSALNVFDGWKQGILTIGTLGYEQKDDYCFFDDEADEEEEISDSEEEEEETNPLVYAKDCEEYLEMNNVGNGDQEFHNYNKERITLAQLFSADTEKLQMAKQSKSNPINHEKGQVIQELQQHYYYKSGPSSFAIANNKLTTAAADARPIHKLHRMMRRMMKRKIHPDETKIYYH